MHAHAEPSLNRAAVSATAHCLTGCAAGEVVGMALATALGWSNAAQIVLAIVLAFVFGYALTMRPVLRAGIPFAQASRVALASDTLSIAIMELIDNLFVLVVPRRDRRRAGGRVVLVEHRPRFRRRLRSRLGRKPLAHRPRQGARGRAPVSLRKYWEMPDRFQRPSVMGIVNVTPDSFSDGGVHRDPDAAAAAARRMIHEGAAIVDVGGESTRPGHEPVSLDEELRRVVPVLERLAGVPVSIDTSKAEVAQRALDLGAELVNDVTALRGDARMAALVSESGAGVCLMHWDKVGEVAEVWRFLEQRLEFAVDSGIDEDRIVLDPGIGFGKTVAQNFELVRRLGELVELGRPVLVGFSRKSSLGRVLGDPDARQGPLSASLAAAVTAYERGATILRVHDVREHVEALTVAAEVAG